MKRILTSSLKGVASWIPAGIYPYLVRRDRIDFFYHAVSDGPMPHMQHLYPVVPVATFEAALLYLKENYHFVDYVQVRAHIVDGVSLPPKAVHLSFDDGYAECYSVVRPLLLKHAIPCTFFLTTGLIDNPILFYRNKQSLCVERLLDPTFDAQAVTLPLSASVPELTPENLANFIKWFKDLRLPDETVIDEVCRALDVDWKTFLQEHPPYLTQAQIRQMQADGFTMGAHTVTHRKLMDLSPDEAETEIVDSCQTVKAITGQEQVPFSFPHSAWGLDRDLLSAIRSRHPEIGLLFDTKGVRRDVDFIVNRVWAERPLTPERRLHAIPEVLHNAYQEAWVDEILALGRFIKEISA